MKKGFSLIELALVIAIIGLLVGGIMGGRALIRSSELRSVITDANQYITSMNTFKSQYRGLPGDITNASSYWSGATDGNGDGNVGTGTETFQYWYQMNQAGFVDTSFTGTMGPGGGNDYVFGLNIPASRVAQSGFNVYNWNLPTPTSVNYAMNYGNAIMFGKLLGLPNSGGPGRAALTPTDAYTIDMKADDGVPGTGTWIAHLNGGGPAFFFGTTTACSTDNSGSVYTGRYQTSTDTISCGFYILTGN